MSDEFRTISGGLIVISACLVAVWFSQLTLWHTDLWGHLSYGRWIVEHGGIPATEPFIPTAKDTPLVATAWLAQTAGYVIIDQFGEAGLQIAFGLCTGLAFLFLVLSCQRQSRSVTWSVVCGLLFLAIASEQVRIIRPQVIALTLFCYLLFELSANRLTRRAVVCIGLAFCLWANTHPSYPVGLLLLSLVMFDHFRAKTVGSGRAAMVVLIAVGATCVNPYGPMVYQTVLSFASSPNLVDIVEWRPISLVTRQGAWTLSAGIVILIGWFTARQRPDLGITVLLGCLTVMLFRYSRFVLWWAVVAGYVMSHFEIVAARLQPIDHAFGRMRISRNTLLALLIACGVAAYSGFPQALQQPPHRLGPHTPVTAVDELLAAELPAATRVFTSYELADYTLWRTWPHHRVVLTSHVHVLPPTEWQRYRAITWLKPGWREKFEELNTTAVVLDIQRHSKLAHALEQTGEWQLISADEVAVALIRDRAN